MTGKIVEAWCRSGRSKVGASSCDSSLEVQEVARELSLNKRMARIVRREDKEIVWSEH